MQDTKDQNRTGEANEAASVEQRESQERRPGLHAGDSRDADGWQKYRKWISNSPAPGRRRGGLDPSLYTWKGYRTWTEQVKRSWSDS